METVKMNRDPSGREIKLSEVNYVWVLLKKANINPKNPGYPTIVEKVQCFTPEEFNAMEKMRNTKSPLIWYRCAGWDEATVLHLPELVGKDESERGQKLMDEIQHPERIVPGSEKDITARLARLERGQRKVTNKQTNESKIEIENQS